MIRLEDGTHDLLRGRHVRLRRHAADRAHSTSPTTPSSRSATTSRWGRARPRSRSSCSATRAACRATGEHSRCCTGTPDAAARRGAERGRRRTRARRHDRARDAAVRPTRSPPATSTPGSGASRPSRSSSPSARSSPGPSRGVGRDRDAGLREPALRPRRARAPARRARRRRRSSSGSTARRRRARPPPARRRRRERRRAPPTPAPSAWTGPAASTGQCFAAQGNILVSGETVDALADDVRGVGGPAARRAAARLPSPRRRRQAATGAASSPRRCSSSSATAATPASRTPSSTCASTTIRAPVDGARAALRASTRRCSARRPPRTGSRSTTALATELRERLARLGYDGELADAFRHWAGTENLEERVDGIGRIDPVVLEELRRA